MALQQAAGFWPVVAAIGGNALVTVAKFGAALISGSSSLFSEAVHSFADTLNQTLLLIGLKRSLKKADESFEYGYGSERFFWALISAVGVFFVGAGITAYNGVSALLHPEEVEFSYIVYAVLLFAFLIELYTFQVAARSLRKAHPSASWLTRLKLADPMTLSVYLEDAVAVGGVLIASIAVSATYYTGNSVYDAIGSIVISFALAATALTLIIKNRTYLLGHSMPEEVQESVIKILEADPAIEKVIDFKSSVLGWGIYRIKCEVEFNGAAIILGGFRRNKMREDYEKITNDYEEFKRFVADYADRIPRLIGKRIDAIEARVKKAHPEIQFIDIELN